ncbi:hypothetical protein BGP_4795 [Beggiatoa sp. PS]|nr:hypothetical protein BGP_4795 [Beggiatoa sp. PS]
MMYSGLILLKNKSPVANKCSKRKIGRALVHEVTELATTHHHSLSESGFAEFKNLQNGPFDFIWFYSVNPDSDTKFSNFGNSDSDNDFNQSLTKVKLWKQL